MLSFLKIVCSAAFILMLTACSSSTPSGDIPDVEEHDMSDFTFYHVTDLHYISDLLFKDTPEFQDMMLNADGKVTHYSPEILSALAEEVKTASPDLLVLSGDITFNGELQSGLGLASVFADIEAAGTDVIVIPGNHDVNYPYAYGFEGEDYYAVENMPTEEFGKIFAGFGLSEAYSKDDASLSYIYQAADNLVFLCLDTSSHGNGVMHPDTLLWAEGELEKIPEGTRVISVTHQTAAVHSEMFNSGIVIDRHEELVALLVKHGVELNLSGHMHVQSIKEVGTLTDIAGSAISHGAVQYGILTVGDGIDYHVKSVDVASWAADQGLEDENLLNFATYAEDFFKQSSMRKMSGDSDNSEVMGEFFAIMNTHYFNGTMHIGMEELKSHEGYSLVVEGDGMMSAYAASVLNSSAKNCTQWSSNS